MSELLELYSDLTIVSDYNFNEGEQIILTQDRRKLKQVLIALLSLSQYRAMEDYELKVSRIENKEWNALLLTLSFQTEMNPKDYKKQFYKYLNGNSIELLNQVEEEVIKETVMLIGPFQMNEDITDDGFVRISFAFFENLEIVYDSLQAGVHTEITQGREDAQIRTIKTPRQQVEKITATFDQYVARVKEREKRSQRKCANMETSSKSKQHDEDNSNSQEEQNKQNGEFNTSKFIDNNISSLNNENIFTPSLDSTEKVQYIPPSVSPKKMNQLTNQPKSNVQKYMTHFRTDDAIKENGGFKSNLQRSTTLLSLNTKLGATKTPQSAKTCGKNLNLSQIKSRFDEDIDIPLKMQSSIYNQSLNQINKQSNHNSQYQISKISKKESSFSKQNATPISIERMNLNLCKQLSGNNIEFPSPKKLQQNTHSSKGIVPQYTFFNKTYSKYKKQDTNYLPAEIIKESSTEQNHYIMSTNFIGIEETEKENKNSKSGNERFFFAFKHQTEILSPNLPSISKMNSKIADNSVITNNHRNSIILYTNQKPQSRDEIKRPMDIIQTKDITENGLEEDVVSIGENKK